MVVVIHRESLSRRLLQGAVTLLCLILCFTASFAQTISFTTDRVVVADLDREVLYTFARYHNKPETWNEVFPVRVTEAQGNMSGKYEVGETSVSFIPAFPFARGLNYQAHFYTEQLALNTNEVYLPQMNPATLTLEFKLEPTISQAPTVVGVFPTSNDLPENLLRFHIQFSSSMTRGEVYKRVHLFDENGREIEKALLVVDEELWDEEMKSLTVLLDPGRIKRGLKANLEMNAPLIAGGEYKLVIEPGWKNFEGVATKDAVVKTFSCHAADRAKPVVSKWQLIAPVLPGDPLVMKMGETYDIGLLRKAFIVTDALGNRVNGQIRILENESVVCFQADRPWTNEKYGVVVNPMLEDLAGNNMNRLFDTDLKEGEGDVFAHTINLTTLSFETQRASGTSLRR